MKKIININSLHDTHIQQGNNNNLLVPNKSRQDRVYPLGQLFSFVLIEGQVFEHIPSFKFSFYCLFSCHETHIQLKVYLDTFICFSLIRQMCMLACIVQAMNIHFYYLYIDYRAFQILQILNYHAVISPWFKKILIIFHLQCKFN